MKKLLFIFIFFLFFSCFNYRYFRIKYPNKIKLDSNLTNLKYYCFKGTAVYNTQNCKGVFSNKDISNNYKKFRDIKKTTIKFELCSDTNIVFYSYTNNSAKFEVELIAGKWKYYLSSNFIDFNTDSLYEIPEKCCKFYNKPYGTINIIPDTINKNFSANLRSYNLSSKKISSVNDTVKDSLFFYFKCNPCKKIE